MKTTFKQFYVDAGLMGLIKAENAVINGENWTHTEPQVGAIKVVLTGNYRVERQRDNHGLIIKRTDHAYNLSLTRPTEYWISDPCYTHDNKDHDQWQRFCDAYYEQVETIEDDEVVNLGDLFCMNTAYGDGIYDGSITTDKGILTFAHIVFEEDSEDDWIEDDYDEI